MVEPTLKPIDGDFDPERCQATQGDGQCRYKAVPGTNNCQRHGGNKTIQSAANKVKQQYNLMQWQGRVDDFADHENVKTLRDEIGVLRMLLENTIKMCKSHTDLLIYSAKIGDLVVKIEKLVVSCSRLEASSGMLLDKSAALHLAGQFIEIISHHIPDGATLDAISKEFATAILQLDGENLQ